MMNSPTLALPTDDLRAAASHRSQAAPFLPHAPISARTAIWSGLMGIALVCPFAILAAFFPVSTMVRQRLQDVASHPGAVLLTSILLGPLLEELVYRGLFLQLARRYVPLWAAIVASSAVFAATHILPAGWIYLGAFPLSCVLSWLAVRSGSLYSSLLCHSVFNAFSGYVILPAFAIAEKTLMRSPNTPLNPLTDLFPFWWTALSLAMIVGAFAMLARELPVTGKSAQAGTKTSAPTES